jgi:hypothetical protein
MIASQGLHADRSAAANSDLRTVDLHQQVGKATRHQMNIRKAGRACDEIQRIDEGPSPIEVTKRLLDAGQDIQPLEPCGLYALFERH